LNNIITEEWQPSPFLLNNTVKMQGIIHNKILFLYEKEKEKLKINFEMVKEDKKIFLQV
jgi:hypothetical protein